MMAFSPVCVQLRVGMKSSFSEVIAYATVEEKVCPLRLFSERYPDVCDGQDSALMQKHTFRSYSDLIHKSC